LGGSGGEQDHFLGNLTVAYAFKDQLKSSFMMSFQYYFIPKNFVLKGIKDKMVSLYPFPAAENITMKG
jgi:thiamine pyrophosphokinase